ncbi:DUF6968 family protein [Paucibacter sp. JuS9]|uniref:DUF6968 family protein n=1 Tax=Paucibacter sp. JuS9 TaxID=3228748 RepID=UPI003756501F
MQPDGSSKPLHARVGTPYLAGDGGWVCPAELEGLDGRYPDVAGETSMQALSLAIGLVSVRLGHLIEKGEHLAYPETPASRLDAKNLSVAFGSLGATSAP